MTATHVNGLEVIADEPAAAPLSTKERPVHFKQIRRLLLADSSETFGCAHCDYTAQTPHRVRSHLVKHSRRGTDPRPGATPSTRQPIDTDDLLARLARGEAAEAQLAHITADRNAWKHRAESAETTLATIREALVPR